MTAKEFQQKIKSGQIELMGKTIKTKTAKGKKKKGKPEHFLQVDCVDWFREMFPQYAECLFAVPNGGSRNALEAMNLKKEGVLPGVFDLFLAVPKGHFNGFFIESKVKPNTLSKHQREFKKRMRRMGYYAQEYYTLEEFKKLIINYMNNEKT